MTRREKLGVLISIIIGIAIECIFYAIHRFCINESFIHYVVIAIMIAILDGFFVWIEAHAERLRDLPFDD